MKNELRILTLAENGGHHIAFTQRARPWLDALASENGFTVDYLSDTAPITDALLSQYALFLQLDYPPYGWTNESASAFERYITNGSGGWIGLHHASLLGEFDGFPRWQWFSHFLGDIRYKNYIPTFTRGTVLVEDANHPCMAGVPSFFVIEQEEWYTYNQSPRPNAHILARVDEDSYAPDSPVHMGDHPVVWTNPNVPARNLYIFMGHSPTLFDNPAYTTLLKNALLWAADR
jgi:type 1 glutamine amidotransferase